MPSLDNSQNPRPITPPGAVAAGTFTKINGVLYYCPEAIGAGQTGPGYWRDVRIKGAPKEPAVAWNDSDILYWDNTNFRFTKTSASNTLRAFASGAALSAATTADIELRQHAG